MSGPKKTKWQIRQETYNKIKEERRLKREIQESEIFAELLGCREKLNYLISQYEDLSQNIVNNVSQWIDEVQNNISYDLRDCWKGIKGINNYLIQQEKSLKENKQKVDSQILLKQLFDAKVSSAIDLLENIEEDYKEILNEGIKQRVELFKKSIATNPDNVNTLKQIDIFKQNINKQYEEYLDKKEAKNYVAKSFVDALNAEIKETSDGNILISGEINGVPISVNLGNNNEINLDTPLDGSCEKGLEALQKKLNNSDINLEAIKVLKTGKILNHSEYKTINKVKA